MSKATDHEAAAYLRRVDRLTRMFLSGERDQAYVLQGLQELGDGKYTLIDPFARYNHMLLSPAAQLECLRRYNEKYWDSRLTDEQLAAVDTSGGIIQRVDNLTVFHVQFDSLEETVEMWWRTYVGEQSKHWCWEELKFDSENLRLLGSNVRHYQPGIHRICIDLVAHWEPENGRTLVEVRDGAKSTGEVLAQLEVLSAYGLHSELFREQDGENLPHSDMPSTDVSVHGSSEPYALCLIWYPSDREANLNADLVGYRYHEWAAPVILGSEPRILTM